MFKEAKKLVKKANSIYVVGHVNPDGDSIGSSFALYFALKNIGKNVSVITREYSDSFAFLPDIKEAKKEIEEDEIDLLICVDSSDPKRLDISEEDYNKAKKVLLLDHHESKKIYGDVSCVDSTLPAASEMIYDFLNYMKIKIDLNLL